MSRFWSPLVQDLKPYVPGEQPRIEGLVKLNTNESPFGPSPRAMAAVSAAADDNLRLYPDPQAVALAGRARMSTLDVGALSDFMAELLSQYARRLSFYPSRQSWRGRPRCCRGVPWTPWAGATRPARSTLRCSSTRTRRPRSRPAACSSASPPRKT